MKYWRTLAGALFIVVVMVLGALGGLVYTGPGTDNAPLDEGTRSSEPRLVEAGTGRSWSLSEVEKMLEQGTQPGETSGTGANGVPPVYGGLTAAGGGEISPDSGGDLVDLSPEQLKENFAQSWQNDEGTITVKSTTPGTRSHWTGAEIDAGG